MVHWIVASWLLYGDPTAAASSNGPPMRYDGYALIEVQVPDAAALADLLALDVDPWMDTVRPGVVPVLVPPQERAALDAGGWTLHVVTEDVQPWLDDENTRLVARVPVKDGGAFADFRDLDEIDVILDDLAASAPDLVTLIDLGMSIEGRSIRGLRIGTGNGQSPALMIIAGQHAREWISVSTALWIATRFVEGAAEPDISALLGGLDVVVVPVVNPDGYAYTWGPERFWRKNRRDGVGVDTNRNFGYGWGGEGAGFQPEEENYAGPSAFSEPESAAVRDWVEAHDELVAFVDLHSFGQLLMWPWGHIYEAAPDDAALEALGNDMTEAMFAIHQESYAPIQGVELYPAAGNSIDWAYGDAGLRAYTIELRPTDVEEFQQGFVLPPSQIVPVGEETMAGIMVLGEWAAMEDGGATTGDDTTDDGGESTTSGTTVDDTGDDDTSEGGSASLTDGTADGTGAATVSASATVADDSGSSSGASEDDDDSGCGCASEPRSNAFGAALLVGAFALRRRRRSLRGSCPG